MAKKEYCIGVDLGGTNIAVGLVNIAERRIVRKHSVKTNAPRAAELIAADIAGVCRKLCSTEGIRLGDLNWIGVASPGIVKDNNILAAFNLGWKNVKLGELIERECGVRTFLGNDANVAAFAEALWGSGEGARSLIAFTLGTGVGGGIVIDGKIWEGTNGFAAEMGHMVIETGGRECSCGKRGCIEAYCSASALIADTKRVMKLYPESSMWKLCEGNIERVSGKTPFIAAREGDAAGKLVVDAFVEYLTIGVSNAINIFQPDVVCIGGGVSREGDSLIIPLRERVLHEAFGTDEARTKVVSASFQNDAGIIGAALLGIQYE